MKSILHHRRLKWLWLVFVLLCLFVVASIPANAQGTGVDDRRAAVENGLLPVYVLDSVPVDEQGRPIDERMALFGVPGVSIAVINDGEIEWVAGYGVTQAGTDHPITPETLFQAASISKPIAATVALALVEQGLLDLDTDVNTYLTSWEVPETSYTEDSPVTLRLLLSHTAGMTVHGFAGYAAGESVPTLIQVLDGTPPANSLPVVVDVRPGQRWRYSGGGYLVMQQVLEDVSGVPFSELASELVLEPVGMSSSLFVQPLPDELAVQATSGHVVNMPIPGRWHTYPELAAAGLWTTPTDLAKWLLEVWSSAQGASNLVLSAETAQEMLTIERSPSGLGPILAFSGTDQEYFGHSGANAGFRADMLLFTGTGDGVVVMTNSDTGDPLILEIYRAVAAVYDWPDLFGPQHKAAVDVDASLLASYTGIYEYEGLQIELAVEESRLIVTLPPELGALAIPFYAETPKRFFNSDFGYELTFVTDAAGVVTRLDISVPGAGSVPFIPQP